MLKLNDALNAVPVVLPEYEQLNLYLVGCGGTGSWLAPSLVRMVRLLEEDDRSVSLTLIDFDIVEAGNIPRQNFIDADLGLNKGAYRNNFTLSKVKPANDSLSVLNA
jgi:tRNA A37 threonylcarbamoyladenosine dehydratase